MQPVKFWCPEPIMIYPCELHVASQQKRYNSTNMSITLSLRQRFQQQPTTDKRTNSWILQDSKSHTAKRINIYGKNRETETSHILQTFGENKGRCIYMYET